MEECWTWIADGIPRDLEKGKMRCSTQIAEMPVKDSGSTSFPRTTAIPLQRNFSCQVGGPCRGSSGLDTIHEKRSK